MPIRAESFMQRRKFLSFPDLPFTSKDYKTYGKIIEAPANPLFIKESFRWVRDFAHPIPFSANYLLQRV
jgi:hypothetical protein